MTTPTRETLCSDASCALTTPHRQGAPGCRFTLAPNKLCEHARELREHLNADLPNGVGNTIDCLCDLIQQQQAEIERLNDEKVEGVKLARLGREHLQAGNLDDALTAFGRIAALGKGASNVRARDEDRRSPSKEDGDG